MSLSLKRPARFAPRAPRVAVAVRGALLLPDDREAPVRLRNLSSQGFMGETLLELAPGTRLGVSLPGVGIQRAEIRWSERGFFGAVFQSPIDLEALLAG